MVLMHMSCMLQVLQAEHSTYPWSFSMLCNDFEGVALFTGVSIRGTATLKIYKPTLHTVQDTTAL